MRNDIDDKPSLTADELVATKVFHRVASGPAKERGKSDRFRLVNHSIAPLPNGVWMARARMPELCARRKILVAGEPLQKYVEFGCPSHFSAS